MSRVAKNPVVLPKGVDVVIQDGCVTVKSNKGSLSSPIPKGVEIQSVEGKLTISCKTQDKVVDMYAGTMRANLNNMVIGVTNGFEKKLVLKGVGYRAQIQGSNLNMTLGLSHPVNFPIPEGIKIEVPSQTDIVIKGIDKQKVGQVAAKIRAYRTPEPYKGKGIQYFNEVIILKEAKKK